MGELVRGVVVVASFPYADLSKTILRPALVLANLGNHGTHNDLILCMITGQPSDFSIAILGVDFENGNLRKEPSYVRPDRLFTAESTLVEYQVGKLKSHKMDEVMKQLRKLFGLDP